MTSWWATIAGAGKHTTSLLSVSEEAPVSASVAQAVCEIIHEYQLAHQPQYKQAKGGAKKMHHLTKWLKVLSESRVLVITEVIAERPWSCSSLAWQRVSNYARRLLTLQRKRCCPKAMASRGLPFFKGNRMMPR